MAVQREITDENVWNVQKERECVGKNLYNDDDVCRASCLCRKNVLSKRGVN